MSQIKLVLLLGFAAHTFANSALVIYQAAQTADIISANSTRNLTSEADTYAEPQDRIINGKEAYIQDFPYQVSIQTAGLHFCGGSILNSRVILTAAHCIKAIPVPTTLKVRYGSAFWNSYGILVGVVKVMVHPRYNATNHQFDIALVKTAAPIVWSAKARKIDLAKAEPADGAIARVSGWGTMVPDALSIPERLRWASVKIVSRSTCGSGKYGLGSNVKSTMICATAANVDMCWGDSGGPLVVNGLLVGLVSWGMGCANPRYPRVFASTFSMGKFLLNADTL